ncbi:uncharacterized protein BCR38DRAFT_423628 [Pseudomassariella vexata]|uniref:Ricin B lectin domain-containing protein n=1 Tax=Pseudomassariella vexata TaxID=1141098 RepID=A0A1Y2EAH6_9PEZI|nr:uncharacterized protein BCR38DRAFT_423628 [Pseudomassariella vexata]ORY68559.1 hypothetical protein BCR38DRAFT_423628 [Pseudomassariella vexata]
MIARVSAILAGWATLAGAGPVYRTVSELDQAAFEEAQQRDDTATRVFANTEIKTSDGRCLFVDELSGDFRANLTPIQVASCGATPGQGWDIISQGKHNNVAGHVLVVSTLTNACFNFDPRRAAGNQALLFSCGGRADGIGEVTESQLFRFDGGAGSLAFAPANDLNSCFTVRGNVVDVVPCQAGNDDQLFTLSGQASDIDTGVTGIPDLSLTASFPVASVVSSSRAVPSEATPTITTVYVTTNPSSTLATAPKIPSATTVYMSAGASTTTVEPTESTVTADAPSATQDAVQAIPTSNPTEPVPVSRAGGTLVPTAAAESHERDESATRAFNTASIKAPNGQCLFINPTAGDFRQNLIPVSLVDCAGTPNEKFDIITAGKHNNAQDSALFVSSLTNGCISFDGRRAVGDTVTLFSCGGRAAGEGLTNDGQLVPFFGKPSFVFAPESERNSTCLVPGNGRLVSAPCLKDRSQVFTIVA